MPHLAEDAWQALPWEAPSVSVFQAGWLAPPQQWAAIPVDQQRAFKALLQIRRVSSLSCRELFGLLQI